MGSSGVGGRRKWKRETEIPNKVLFLIDFFFFLNFLWLLVYLNQFLKKHRRYTPKNNTHFIVLNGNVLMHKVAKL